MGTFKAKFVFKTVYALAVFSEIFKETTKKYKDCQNPPNRHVDWDQTFGEAKVIVKTQKVVKICHDMIGW